MNEQKVLEWAEFVTTKFSDNHEGWQIKYRPAGLVHLRYKRDSTGYNHWAKRLWRATREFLPAALTGRRRTGSSFRSKGLMSRIAMAHVYLRKDKNLPDATVNGNIFHWSEDAEYVTFFQPRVGMKVLEFINRNPKDPWAKSILDEMVSCANESFPKEENE